MDDWQLDMDMLQRIIDALPVGVWIADTRGNLKMNNPAGRDIWRLRAGMLTLQPHRVFR